MNSSEPSIAVLYLARKAEGIKPFREFICSYIDHPAGIQHDLVVIFKGFDGGKDLEEAQAAFSSVSYISIEVSDEGFDLGSYLETAKRIKNTYICCFNTFSIILADDWLRKFYTHLSCPDVGIVGATGSYEGTRDSMMLLQKVIWLYSQPMISHKLRKQLEKYFKFVLEQAYPHIFKKKNNSNNFWKTNVAYLKNIKSLFRKIFNIYLLLKNAGDFELQFEDWWKKLRNKEDFKAFDQFPGFPNPHIRSNAFMIHRDLFLSLKKRPFIKKYDVCFFESGYEGITRQVFKLGKKARIVGKDGNGYEIHQWYESNTFRLGDQTNLLIADNQTAFFANANEATRVFHVLSTWGEKAILRPTDFPDLKIKFSKPPNFLNDYP